MKDSSLKTGERCCCNVGRVLCLSYTLVLLTKSPVLQSLAAKSRFYKKMFIFSICGSVCGALVTNVTIALRRMVLGARTGPLPPAPSLRLRFPCPPLTPSPAESLGAGAPLGSCYLWRRQQTATGFMRVSL